MVERGPYRLMVPFVLVMSLLTARALPAQIPAADPERGLVVFYRMSSFKGKAIRFPVQDAEGSIGFLLSGGYLYKFVPPGEHTFWSQVISQDAITLNVDAGKTYYVKGDVLMGVYAGRPKFTRVSDDKAQSDLAKLTGTTTPPQ
jgi:hypothetical protein